MAETQINKDQVRDQSILNRHISDSAAIAWPKINKYLAVPSDIGAESPLTFTAPLVRTLDTVTLDPSYLGTFPIAVSKGGTGLTSVTANQILFGSTSTELASSANFSFDPIANNLRLNSTLFAFSSSSETTVKFYNDSTGKGLVCFSGAETNKLYLSTQVIIGGPGDPNPTMIPHSSMYSPTDGEIVLTDTTGVDFYKLVFGTNSNIKPALRVNGADLEVKLGDDTDYTNLRAKEVSANNVKNVIDIPTTGSMSAVNVGNYTRMVAKYSWTNSLVTALGASLTGNILVCTLPAKAFVTSAVLVIDTTAGGTATLSVSVGSTGPTYTDLVNTVDAQSSPGFNLGAFTSVPVYSTSTTDIYAHFISTGTNLNTVTTCTGTIYLEYSILP